MMKLKKFFLGRAFSIGDAMLFTAVSEIATHKHGLAYGLWWTAALVTYALFSPSDRWDAVDAFERDNG